MTEFTTGFDYPQQTPGLADRLLALDSEAADLESLTLSATQLADLALVMTGAYRPLRGFMVEADYDSVLDNLTLATGQAFPLPVLLDADMTTAHAMERGKRIALRDAEGVAIAVLSVDDVWRKDSRRESRALGVAEHAYGDGSCYLGGEIEGIRLPSNPFFARLRPPPAVLAEYIHERGFSRVLAVECQDLIDVADHEIITRAAAELDAAILLQPAIGTPDPGNLRQVVTIKCFLAALGYFPRAATMLALLDYPSRSAGVREFLLHALLRMRHGATHFMMKNADLRALESDPRLTACLDGIGIEVAAWPQRGTPGTGAADGNFPEVAEVLAAQRGTQRRQGFTLFFTGLSGSGKSTIAKFVQAWLAELDPRPVTLLDDDVVRRQFSKGLGFSRQDRDTNVRRIGAAAADITKRGGVAICCPIAPYADTRKAVRAIIEPHGPMIEIHVATPLEVCERRDPKGLYKKARAGRIPNFTGIDDPYESPQSPDIRIDASEGSAEDAAAVVMTELEKAGLISSRDA